MHHMASPCRWKASVLRCGAQSSWLAAGSGLTLIGERTEDIPKLVRHFTELYARRMNKRIDEIPSDTMDALVRYRWPGNIRELQNFIERAVILSPFRIARPHLRVGNVPRTRRHHVSMTGLAEVERDHIIRTLEANNWVVGGRNGAGGAIGNEEDIASLPNAKAAHQPSSALPTKWRRA
jgi:hypothetical protein